MKLILLGLFLLGSFAFAKKASAPNEQEAISSAETWLKLVDEGKYGDSWKAAAAFFKSKVTDAQWEKSVSEARKPFGKLVSRKLKTKTFATTLPGAPKGQYEIIQFDAVFENNNEAVETVTPMMDKDNHWRVSGYYIR